MNNEHLPIYALVMAGGEGLRFWPAGRRSVPKQLLHLTGNKEDGNTMLEDTVQRLFPLIPPENVIVITNIRHLEKIRSLLPIPKENIIGEPMGRDTAPCIALGTALIQRKVPEALIAVIPADHLIRPAKAFQQTLSLALEQAAMGRLVTIGATPTYPATGYGYLQIGASIAPHCHVVTAFHEKPSPTIAAQYLHEGNYQWNTGLFAWSTRTIAHAFQCFLPDLFNQMVNWAKGNDFFLDFQECSRISIDYVIMEKAKNVVSVEANFQWRDLGSWSAMREVFPMDDHNNAIKGNVATLDCYGNVLVSDEDTLLGVVGMNGIAVIKSGNGVLVCPLAEEQKVKDLVKNLPESLQGFL